MKHFLEQNKDEIYKGNGQSYWGVSFVLFIIYTIVVASFISSSFYFPLFISFSAITITYLIFGSFYQYYFYSDRVEIIYPYRKIKNRCILRNEIKFVRYYHVKSETMLAIFYLKNGTAKDKFIINLRDSYLYIYDSPHYKILKRINDWNIKIEIDGPKELKTIIQ
jgi:hypothetical protein